ncbi:MAG: V-type ATP synthase subunit D [Candidatus Acidifodinimicrobium sp.]
MENIRVTRKELIDTEGKIRLAERGLELLKMKRSIVVLGIFRKLKELGRSKSSLSQVVYSAERAFNAAIKEVGEVGIEMASSEVPDLKVDILDEKTAGISTPAIKMENPAGGNDILMNSSLYDLKRTYSRLLGEIIKTYLIEKEIRDLLRELFKLNRRTNSIEYTVLPNLISTASYLRQSLDDIERGNIVSLKFVKKNILEKDGRPR